MITWEKLMAGMDLHNIGSIIISPIDCKEFKASTAG